MSESDWQGVWPNRPRGLLRTRPDRDESRHDTRTIRTVRRGRDSLLIFLIFRLAPVSWFLSPPRLSSLDWCHSVPVSLSRTDSSEEEATPTDFLDYKTWSCYHVWQRERWHHYISIVRIIPSLACHLSRLQRYHQMYISQLWWCVPRKILFSNLTIRCLKLELLPSTVLGDIYDQVVLRWPLCFFMLIIGFMTFMFRSNNVTSTKL